jgi:hypothetical protein
MSDDPTLLIPLAAIAVRAAGIEAAAKAHLPPDLSAIVCAYARHTGLKLFTKVLNVQPTDFALLSQIEMVYKEYILFAKPSSTPHTVLITVKVKPSNEVWHTTQVSIERLWDYMCGDTGIKSLYHKRIWPTIAPKFMCNMRDQFVRLADNAQKTEKPHV